MNAGAARSVGEARARSCPSWIYRLVATSAVIVGAVSALGCANEPARKEGPKPYAGPPIPWAYEPFPNVPVPADNPITDAKIALGNALFYDPILSSDGKVACATCHSEQWGMTDGLPLSVGVDGVGATGPGRTGPNMTTRNAPTLWNAAFRSDLFWDGRSPSLEDQAMSPLKAPKEMNRPPDEAAAALHTIPAYVALFQKAFPTEADPISPKTIAMALATLERTVVSQHAPYDHYVAGDQGALSAEEVTGMGVFASSGCADCHAPPLFEGKAFVGRFASSDVGRYDVTGDEADRGAFRVPTLRNLRETGPYFHDGSVADMEQAISAEVDLQVQSGLSPPLSADELAALVKFLKSSLMDRSEEPFRPDTVPSGLEVPPDGFRIPR